MAKQTINIGAAPNDGTGTPLRTSFDYCNLNFTELYTAVGPSGNNIVVPGTATITGDLTVDTSTLKVDSTNNRVGIGTATPAAPLDVRSNGNTAALFLRTTDPAAAVSSAYIQAPVSTGFSSTVPVYGFWYQNSGMGNPANDTLNWIIASGEAMRLNSAGLGLGVTPSAFGGGRKAIQISSPAQLVSANLTMEVGSNWWNDGTNYKYTNTNAVSLYSPSNGTHTWYIAPSGTAGNNITFTQAMTLDASGNLLVGVASANANGGVLQLKSGITFPATQVASSDANTLDDYEEGTFTPTIIGTSTAGTGTYSVQSGTYTKVGRLVSCQIFLDWTAHTGTGDMRISGLPFQVSSASNYFAAAAIGYFSNVSLSAGNIATGYAINATSVITLGQYPTGGGAGAGIAMDTSGEILISVTYIV
jgi:hypothetical protein